MATLAVAMTLVRRTWDIFWRNGDPGGRQARCYSSIDDTKVLLTASKGGSLPGGDRKQAGRGQALSDGGFFRALPWGAVRERRSGDTPETPPGAAAPGPCREKPMLERGASPAPTIHDRDAQSSMVGAHRRSLGHTVPQTASLAVALLAPALDVSDLSLAEELEYAG